MKVFTFMATFLLLVSLGACRDESAKDQEQQDQQRLAAMRQKIVERIDEARCSGEGECATLALGSKPCGGPREYLVYSTAGADPDQLQELADAYTRFDAIVNERYGYMSDCMFVTPPTIDCVDGNCVVVRP